MDLPDAARDAVAQWRDTAMGASDEVRLVPVAGLHVTLVFLGWTSTERVAAVWEAACDALFEGQPPPLLTPAQAVGVPRHRPRLVALDLADEDGRTAARAHAVADSLTAAELHEPDRRPFWPHLTLARLRKGARWRPPEESPDLGPFEPASVTLYRSHLSSEGARYEPLHRRPLG